MRFDRRDFIVGTVSASCALLTGCMGSGGGDGGSGGKGEVNTDDFQMGDLELTSSVFSHNGDIPAKFTADGEDISPPLSISNVPDNAETFAIIVDDPDAPTDTPFVHWLIWNIPSETKVIPRGIPQKKTVSILDGARQGQNDFSSNNLGYRGPDPPSGTHTYQFKLYALDKTLDTSPGATKDKLLEDMDGSVVGRTVLKGEYSN